MWVEVNGKWIPCRIVERKADTIVVNALGTLYEVFPWKVSSSRPLKAR